MEIAGISMDKDMDKDKILTTNSIKTHMHITIKMITKLECLMIGTKIITNKNKNKII